jgi:hypothetical protein
VLPAYQQLVSCPFGERGRLKLIPPPLHLSQLQVRSHAAHHQSPHRVYQSRTPQLASLFPHTLPLTLLVALVSQSIRTAEDGLLSFQFMIPVSGRVTKGAEAKVCFVEFLVSQIRWQRECSKSTLRA